MKHNIELAEIHNEHIDLVHSQTHHPDEISIHNHENFRVKKSPKPYDYNDLWKAFLIETMCSAIHMLLINYTKGYLEYLIFGLYFLMTTFYPVSGCNMNMMISFNLWFYEEEYKHNIQTIRRTAYIFFFQPLGTMLGSLLAIPLIRDDIHYVKLHTAPAIQIIFVEWFFSGFIIFIALHAIVSKRTRPAQEIVAVNFAFFACCLYFCIRSGENISGGVYNPTVYLVTNAIAYVRNVDNTCLQNWYMYFFPSMIGGFMFTCLYKYFFEPFYCRMFALKMKWEDSFFVDKDE